MQIKKGLWGFVGGISIWPKYNDLDIFLKMYARLFQSKKPDHI
jgi:hypothetical protein